MLKTSGNLVSLHENKLWADSSLIAKKFQILHKDVILTAKRVLADLPEFIEVDNHHEFKPECKFVERKYNNRKFNAALMNREFFSLLAMRFTTKRARKWQIEFNSAFYIMENKLSNKIENESDREFLTARTDSKLQRREMTDVIKEFIEYALTVMTVNGVEMKVSSPQTSKHYYKHFSNAAYSCMGLVSHKDVNLRDSIHGLQVYQLMMLENCIATNLDKYMNLGIHYKEIYKLVKIDLLEYSKHIAMVPLKLKTNKELLGMDVI